MNGYVLDMARLTYDSDGTTTYGYAVFGSGDGIQLSLTRDEWLNMGRPVTLSVVVHAVEHQS